MNRRFLLSFFLAAPALPLALKESKTAVQSEGFYTARRVIYDPRIDARCLADYAERVSFPRDLWAIPENLKRHKGEG